MPAASTLLGLWLTGCTPTSRQAVPVAEKPQATAPALPVASGPVAVHLTPNELQQQRVHALTEQVEQAYKRGAVAYQKGRLAEAKAEFDMAVDLMLQSKIDIKTTPQLQDEFNRILDQVNGLEMEVLKRGNGFTAQEEETPAEAAADVTFTVDPNLVAKARAELATTKSDLPLVVNDYVAGYINFFANTKRGHYTLLHSMQRGGRYKPMIERVLAEEGVPQDLIYLAVAESGFNPRAMNPGSHAGGMWQFMPNDKFYGLARTAYVDERFDPEKSTRAYARYMKFIYNQLGDWYLSMAAYNWGTGNVQHAVQKTGYADFWELYRRNNLPAQTKGYVPEILAAIIVANHPTEYGLDELALDPPVLTDTVTINYSVDLRLVSDIVGAPLEEMQALNPSLLRTVTPPDTSFDLHLPAGTATLYEQRIALVPESHRNGWRYHRISSEETLASVAAKFHVSSSALAEANQLQADADLKGVEALAIPQAAAPAVRQRGAVVESHSQSYTTRKGDTLVTIADRFGVSLADLRHWNKLSGTSVRMEAGRRLHVSEPATASTAKHESEHASKEEAAGSTGQTPCKVHRSSRHAHGSCVKSEPKADGTDKKADVAEKKEPSTKRSESSAKRSEEAAKKTEPGARAETGSKTETKAGSKAETKTETKAEAGTHHAGRRRAKKK
ncbi:transglycosylase SLT domain-containing protein [Telmatobacter bradus]|uniref:transglycosylase SLT domain-containing protein n=1 Tax=Telmatobacter bradus TaxID=474953 RepID=UPI003B4345DC